MLGNRKSQMSFAQTPAVHTARSMFDRSFAIKDTFDFDYLVPIFVDEILPGDTANVTVNTFARLATQKVPIMDNMYVDYFFFFVPSRLVWTNWEKFNGAQDNPDDSTDFTIPVLDDSTAVTGWTVGSIFDKMGLPTGVPGISNVNALPFRAYNLIWNEWFRDQNMQDSVTVNKDNGDDPLSDYQLLKRGKRHDYFTSCLPWPQKGPDVTLPLGTSAPVIGIGKLDTTWDNGAMTVYESDGTQSTYANSQIITATNNKYVFGVEKQNIGGTDYPNIRADLSAATAATINQLREAFLMQSLFELDARGGTRYVEILLAHFNVQSPDFRLQRPEYLGGGSSKINSHPVAQTSPTSGSNAQGQLAAFGTMSSTGQIGFTKSFVEHGYVIGMACARADLTYQQGLNRMWSRQTRYDFFWPKLQQLGEQAVLMKEIYAKGTVNDEKVFGYQERHAEYRYNPSQIKGEFRSTYATPLDYWHLAEEFGAEPALDSTFIEQNTPIDRAIAVTGAPHLLFDAYFNYKHARPMVSRAIPATLGRF